jgi:hypothetical protein
MGIAPSDKVRRPSPGAAFGVVSRLIEFLNFPCCEGDRLELVKDGQLTSMLARQNDLSPVAMHWV